MGRKGPQHHEARGKLGIVQLGNKQDTVVIGQDLARSSEKRSTRNMGYVTRRKMRTRFVRWTSFDAWMGLFPDSSGNDDGRYLHQRGEGKGEPNDERGEPNFTHAVLADDVIRLVDVVEVSDEDAVEDELRLGYRGFFATDIAGVRAATCDGG